MTHLQTVLNTALNRAADDWRDLRSLPPGWLVSAVVDPDGHLVVAMFEMETFTLSLLRNRHPAARR